MTFKDLYGHEKQRRMLQLALSNNRIAHAYLFYGMRGIGKRSTALAFAKALNCREGRGDACGRCASCRKADHGNHPDLGLIKPAGQSIRVQEIREVQQQMAFRPYEGGWRTFIFIDAERMNGAAANALLKTLEEPAPLNTLILISSRPDLLPLTVMSRCQPLRFNPLARETVQLYLQERLSIPAGTARLLAASCGGSIGRAIEMNDTEYLSIRDQIFEQVMGLQAEDPLRLFSGVQSFGQERRAILERIDILKGCLRDALVYKETGGIDGLFNRDRALEIQSFAGVRSTPDLLKCIGVLDRAYGAIDRNANKSLTLEVMMFRVSAES